MADRYICLVKKEYAVKSIDSAPDGAPYVVVSLSSLKDISEGNVPPMTPFGQPKMMGFSSNMGDMMKDLNKMLSGMGNTGLTQLKMDMHEYKEMNLSVGDKVYLELTKAESLGV